MLPHAPGASRGCRARRAPRAVRLAIAAGLSGLAAGVIGLGLGAGLATSPLRAAPEASAGARPSVVLILADDVGWGDVGFNGRKDWTTPSLDRLAREGTVFTRWYAAAPICAPSRAALLTGKYTLHCGVTANGEDLPRGEVTLAEALKARGYSTALFGKWHHGAPRPGEADYVHPMDQGFDEFVGFTEARHAWEHFPKELWFGREKRPVERRYADSRFTDLAVDFISRRKGEPFFLFLSCTSTHLLMEAPSEDIAAQAGKFHEKDAAAPLNATYAAMVTRLDKEVGRVLQALEGAGIARDTIVIFSSDNGATFEAGNKGTSSYHDSNFPFRGQKRTLWEGGIRVPGVVRWPAQVPAGRASAEIFQMIDLFPTLLAAAGGEPDPAWRVDGRCVLSMWKGRAPAPERALFWEWRSEGANQVAAMRGDWKLVVTHGGRPELFDLAADPGERRNVIAEHEELAADLKKELEEWLRTERKG